MKVNLEKLKFFEVPFMKKPRLTKVYTENIILNKP